MSDTTIFCDRCQRDIATVRELWPTGAPMPDPTQGGGQRSAAPRQRPAGTLDIAESASGHVRAERRDAPDGSFTWRYRLACGGRRGHKTNERTFTEETLWAAYDRDGDRISLADVRRVA